MGILRKIQPPEKYVIKEVTSGGELHLDNDMKVHVSATHGFVPGQEITIDRCRSELTWLGRLVVPPCQSFRRSITRFWWRASLPMGKWFRRVRFRFYLWRTGKTEADVVLDFRNKVNEFPNSQNKPWN